MNKTKRLCYLAVLTALYVVLSAFLKLPLGVGNIQIDLGYLVFAVALCMFGMAGTLVGVIGCSIESILFSAYGFSVGWAAANLVIGVGCGIVFRRYKSFAIRVLTVVLFTALGMIGVKTVIECALYSIPLMVKIPKSCVAFLSDSITMIGGLLLYSILEKRIHRDGNV